jgi:magnesium-transporting ATPase (P-type)
MFTVTLALGSMELASRGVLVTRLSALEDAASMDVLCVDKTGTLTQNRLTVAEVIPCPGLHRSDVLLYGALASQEANHDPIDQALIDALHEMGVTRAGYEPVHFTPFDPRSRQTEALVRHDGQCLRVVKGAVDVVAGHCRTTWPGLQAAVQASTARGHRILAVARGRGEELALVGMVALADPVRSDAAALVTGIKALGVDVKMLTGDWQPIAREIARQVGLEQDVSRAADLAALAPAEAAQVAEASAGFAEIYPEGKYTVVQSLQARGHIVGMTGDGINDAPSLRQAEVGIAVNNATDVAKGAASVVLTSEGLAGIVDLIKSGRSIDQRISIWVVNKISRTVLKTGFVVLAYLLTGKLVVSALAMLAMMFMTDFVKIALATDNVRGAEQPHRWNVIGLVQIAVLLGLLMVAEALAVLWIGWRFWGLGSNEAALHTYVFETLLYFALFSLPVVRERRRFWASLPSRTLLIALFADMVIATIVGTVGLPSLAPLPVTATLTNLGLALLFSLVINDSAKCALVRRLGLDW